ncbi:fatty acyl-AMP ligase [Streptomyces sp. VB1]|uniref:fatty acyl-AMP ligase n=1 Tax=Streptomyces sp. VB1 TaxID=2986803 RepID=UPI002242A0B3|nr:fatty acyl-AMP ligase [Streptomyces sp. VB1]UZI26838.1 fatty acyl-AMP ligase [Streptomyces sp. VB1]
MADIREARNVADLLGRRASEHPAREALRYLHDVETGDGTSLTYAEVHRAASGVARDLSGRFAAGDRLLLLHGFGPAFLAAFLGCLYAGMVAVPAPLPGRYRHERRRVISIARSSGVVAALTDDANTEDVAEWMREEGLTGLPLLSTDGAAAEASADAALPAVELNRETLAMLQYTSGSTGEPKGVMVSHGNLLRNIETLSASFGFNSRTVFGGWIPHFHDMGLIGQLLPPLFLGSTGLLMSPSAFIRRPYSWLRMIDTYDVEWSAAPNFAYDLCLRRVTDAQLETLDLSRWRWAANGSEPIHAGTLTHFAKRFAPTGFRTESLSPCYGLAESTVYVSGGPAPTIMEVDAEMLEARKLAAASEGRPGRALVGCGTPQDVDLRIVDPETGSRLPPGAVGEIWLRGPSVATGYWNHPTATEATFGATLDGIDGRYLRTGDLGALHEGDLYVTGRIKEMITAHGRNLYPQDIEYELRAAHPELASHVGAVFTVARPGTDPALVLTHEVKGRLDEAGLRELARGMRQTVAREHGMTAACVVLLRPGKVRRTTSGKIQRDAMRKLFEEGELEAVWIQGEAPGRDAGGARA